MKKVFYSIIIMSILLLTGCGETNVAITAKNAKNNEVILDSKEKVQFVIKESFDKSYYNKDDLVKYIKEDISNFNSNNGTNIEYNSMKVKDGNVYVVLDFSKIDDYNKYEEYKITSLSSAEAKQDDIVPDTLTVYGKSKSIGKSEALSKSDMKVAILSVKDDSSESSSSNKVKTNFTVAGKIKYVSNAKKVDSNTVKVTSLKKPAVVIYK